MNLDRRINLYQPGRTPRGSDGSRLRASPTVYRIFAKRQARQGSEGIVQDTRVEEQRVIYTIRFSKLAARINTTWWIQDNNIEYRIESAYESHIGRRQFLTLVAVARL